MDLIELIQSIAGGIVILVYGVAVLGAIFVFLSGLVEEIAEWLEKPTRR